MAQLAVGLLALFGEIERTYAVERAAHARSVATEKGRRVGRPSVVTDAQLAHATQLRNDGATIAEITAQTGLTRSTLYRHLPQRPSESVTAADTESGFTSTVDAEHARAHTGPLICPTCGHLPTTRGDVIPHRDDLASLWLHLDDRHRIREQHHCARCQPHGHVLVVSCNQCGDGPLLPAPPTPTTNCHDRS